MNGITDPHQAPNTNTSVHTLYSLGLKAVVSFSVQGLHKSPNSLAWSRFLHKDTLASYSNAHPEIHRYPVPPSMTVSQSTLTTHLTHLAADRLGREQQGYKESHSLLARTVSTSPSRPWASGEQRWRLLSLLCLLPSAVAPHAW